MNRTSIEHKQKNYPKWSQNASKMLPKGSQNGPKIILFEGLGPGHEKEADLGPIWRSFRVPKGPQSGPKVIQKPLKFETKNQ